MNPFLDTARNEALRRIGLPRDTNTLTLDHATRERYTRALAEVILQFPENFAEQELQNARARLARDDIPPPEPFTIGEAFGTFGSGVLEQADSLNPLSEQNRGNLSKLLAGLAAVAVAIWALTWAAKTSPRR